MVGRRNSIKRLLFFLKTPKLNVFGSWARGLEFIHSFIHLIQSASALYVPLLFVYSSWRNTDEKRITKSGQKIHPKLERPIKPGDPVSESSKRCWHHCVRNSSATQRAQSTILTAPTQASCSGHAGERVINYSSFSHSLFSSLLWGVSIP